MSNVILKELTFSNMFSYGENNVVVLDNKGISQLTGINGNGKSSIALVIQEILYNKNFKGIKKGDILNRLVEDKTWTGNLTFLANEKNYEVQVTRTGAVSKVKLLEEGRDISEHKVLDTYKKISEIIGFSFEVFSQLTYQSSKDLLDFLKATDVNRKNFLIKLFNLEKYIEIGEKVKVISAEANKELIVLQTELKSIEDFLEAAVIPELMVEQEGYVVDSNLAVRISELTKEIDNINDTCKRIDRNNMYIKERDSLVFDISLHKPKPYEYTNELQTLKLDIIGLRKDIETKKQEISSLSINDRCKACGQTIDVSHLVQIRSDLETQINASSTILIDASAKLKLMQEEYDAIIEAEQQYNNNETNIRKFEQLVQVIDNTIPVTYPDYTALTNEKNKLEQELATQTKEANAIISFNNRVFANNAKRDILIEQKEDFIIRQLAIKESIIDKSDTITSLNILKKAFSTSGIVAFKLENLTKDLEITINHYLSLLSDGQFQIEFTLDREKLNISVINNGISSPIETVSEGEFSRIQTSILLAIKKLLASLSSSSVNLLFLDEITGVLDSEGKEKLIEVLQREHNLNVFLIAHDFTHPLVPKINIEKINNISYLSY